MRNIPSLNNEAVVYLHPNIVQTPVYSEVALKFQGCGRKKDGRKNACIILGRTSRALSIAFIIICSNTFSQEPPHGMTASSALHQIPSPFQCRQELWQAAGKNKENPKINKKNKQTQGIVPSVLIPKISDNVLNDNGNEKFCFKDKKIKNKKCRQKLSLYVCSDVGCAYSLISRGLSHWDFFFTSRKAKQQSGCKLWTCSAAPVARVQYFLRAAGQWGRSHWLAELFLSSADSDEAICIHLCMGPTMVSNEKKCRMFLFAVMSLLLFATVFSATSRSSFAAFTPIWWCSFFCLSSLLNSEIKDRTSTALCSSPTVLTSEQ